MEKPVISGNHVAVRRKGLIHAAALALLMALLACNVGATGDPTPTETPTPDPAACGDGVCAADESAESCPVDCEAATATPTEEADGEDTDEPTSPTVRTTSELNVRSGPNINCVQIGNYPTNTEVEVLAKDPSGQWWQVPYGNTVGWMSASFTTPVTDLSGVQTIPGPACQAPHTSTSTPTNTSNPPTATSTATATATTDYICGNDIKEGTEQCDGGGCGLGFFCNDSCACEQLQIQLPVCGNNVKEGSEQCDGGGCGIGQYCNDSCACEQLQIQLPVCGNNVKEGSEQCDDGGCPIGKYCTDSCTCQTLQISP